MKLSENWLREFCDPALTTAELVEGLTMAGLEVNGVEPVAGDFSKVVVGEILASQPHPDAERLTLCRVSAGGGERQVVCGAPNARVGLKAPFAPVGASVGEIKIKAAKLRGQVSQGMLCSEKELGISDNHEGLMELPLDAPVGKPLADYLELNDKVIDLDLTPNRSDCLSMVGLGRETGLINAMGAKGAAKKGPAVKDVDVKPVPAAKNHTFPVQLAAGEACPRFAGRVIKGIDTQAETPVWLKEKLRRAGIRSLSPVVDITNFVMLELGQPLHAYDLAKLKGKIVVRQAKAGEKLTLLDGKEVTLNKETLLITDKSGPIGMAGVMGGLSTAVSDSTENIFLEGAFFAPKAIAGQARAYGMATDAAHRFERGVDWQGQSRAIERATQLLLDIAGGEAGPVVETVDKKKLPSNQVITLRANRIGLLLGVDIEDKQVDAILARLGFSAERVTLKTGAGWKVSAPSYRFDINIEADLIEEVGRVFGYNKLPIRTPKASLTMLPNEEERLPLNRLKDRLVARGYHEAITYSFVDADFQRDLDPSKEPIGLANPLSSEMSVMRTTLWGGLLRALAYNLNRQQSRVRLFEAGLTFTRPPNQAALKLQEIKQIPHLAGVACGARQGENWANGTEPLDFYDVKGDLEALLAMTAEEHSFSFVAGQHPALHPGQCAEIKKNGQTVGYLGLLAPKIQQRLELRQDVFLFELQVAAMTTKQLVQSEPPSRFPEVRRDLAILVGKEVPAAALLECIKQSADNTLKHLGLFDVYQGEGIDAGKKSLALCLTFQHPSRTLTDTEINKSVESIVARLAKDQGAELRG